MKRICFTGLIMIWFLTLAGCENPFNRDTRDVTVSGIDVSRLRLL